MSTHDCRKQGSLSQHIRQWAQHNKRYRMDLRVKTVVAAIELAEMIAMLERKPEAADCTDDAENKIKPVSESKSLMTSDDEWITFAQAAEILAVSKPTLSRWADDGKIQCNGKKGRLRKLNKVSVLLIKQAMENEAMRQDVRDLREDAKRMKDAD